MSSPEQPSETLSASPQPPGSSPGAPTGSPLAHPTGSVGEGPLPAGQAQPPAGAVPPEGVGAAPPDGLPTGLWDGWLAQAEGPLRELAALLDNGGPVMLVLAALSVLALAIVLVKVWQLAWLRVGAAQPVERALALWGADRPGEAVAALATSRQPVAQLVRLAMTGVLSLPGPECAPAVHAALLGTLREELVRVAARTLEDLRAWLRALETIAAASPLLGLLGTVLGMIEAFRRLEGAGTRVDPAILSGGIWEALLTTAAGLAVAIPALLAHAWLERRVERTAHRMEDGVTRVFTRGAATGGFAVAAHPRPRPASRPAAARGEALHAA